MDLFVEIASSFRDRARLYATLSCNRLAHDVLAAAEILREALYNNHKVLIFGNGGSAAEAQHFAAEFVGRFERDRRALPAIALTTDTSILTAQANDVGYASVFSRQIEAFALPGDVAVAMTTSDVSEGHSENIREGLLAARKAGCRRVGLFSEKTHILKDMVDVAIIVPSRSTSLIQETHLAVIHILSGLVEQGLP